MNESMSLAANTIWLRNKGLNRGAEVCFSLTFCAIRFESLTINTDIIFRKQKVREFMASFTSSIYTHDFNNMRTCDPFMNPYVN